MTETTEIEEKYSLITRHLQLQNDWAGEQLLSLLTDGRRPRVQWPTAPTGKPHIGYLIPLVKFNDFIRAGAEVIIECVDVYAFLINYKYPWEQVTHRTVYYRLLFTAILRAIGIPPSKVKIVLMSSYQGTLEYERNFWKLVAACSQEDVKSVSEEVGSSTMLGPLLAPLVHALGEPYLDIDVQFGGTDQKHGFDLCEKVLPRIGHERRAHLMNVILPSLKGGKMSSSHPADTKIMFLDDEVTVNDKIAGATCKAQIIEGNGVLPIVQHVLMPISEIRSGLAKTDHERNGSPSEGESFRYGPFTVDGAPAGSLLSVKCYGETTATYRHYRTYTELENDYMQGVVEPASLKEAVAAALNQVLQPIREIYKGSEEWQEADRKGYPEDWPA